MKNDSPINPTYIQNYQLIPVQTNYIKPNQSLEVIIKKAGPYLEDGDFLVISETPVSISQGRLVDESQYKPSILAILLADFWSKYLWGYLLGPLFRIKKRTIKNLRKLPPQARAHKEVVLQHYGLKHALKPASEAGIDLSNVPGTLVSLLPQDPPQVARDISHDIQESWGKEVVVLIIDTDATYQIRGHKFTSLPQAMEGIKADKGIMGYVLGRFGTLIGPTPLGASENLELDIALEIGNIAEIYQKSIEGHAETIYQMKKSFKEEVDNITVEMLDSITHTPAVIIKNKLK